MNDDMSVGVRARWRGFNHCPSVCKPVRPSSPPCLSPPRALEVGRGEMALSKLSGDEAVETILVY